MGGCGGGGGGGSGGGRQEAVELTDGHPEEDTSAEEEPQEGALTPK